MTFSTQDIGHLLLALTLLLGAGHTLGYAFRRLRQPPVIGEILGGLLLGPTVFGAILPEWQHAIFATTGPTATVLGAAYQLGLLFLMFCSGAEMRTNFEGSDRRTAAAITLTGTILPLAAGLAMVHWINVEPLMGPANSRSAFILVFGIAIAVTSIPVISRILADLGILETAFARIVLAAAVAEDVILYVMLSAALGLVGKGGGGSGTLAELLGLHGDTWPGLTYHVVASVVFFVIALAAGPALFRWITGYRFNLLQRSSPTANTLLLMLTATGIAILLGVAPMLGAFVAGLAAGRVATPKAIAAREVIKSFSFAFFIPVYFTVVGLKLNLRTEFDPFFFAWFLAAACALKALSVYLGARFARESNSGAWNLAIAMNARGGPGIVLASLALDAGIVSERFYSSLVMLAIVTSLIAGSWLHMVVRKGWPLRDG